MEAGTSPNNGHGERRGKICSLCLLYRLQAQTLTYAKSEYAISSPIPAEAFCNALCNMDRARESRIRGLDAITHGEYTVMVLQELDLGRLRYGLVTRDAAGRLQVFDRLLGTNSVLLARKRDSRSFKV